MGGRLDPMSNPFAILNSDAMPPHRFRAPIRVIGIDLGTTNSTVAEAVWRQDSSSEVKVKCLEIEQDTTSGLYTHVVVPSVVAHHNGREWVGEGAKRLYARAPELGLESTRNIFLECKNDIGVQRTYHRAPEGYRSPAEIGSRVLRFLRSAAERVEEIPISRIVVTVPASFQASQRLDTVRAAELAGIPISGGDLLDEPVAAFMDYVFTHVNSLKDQLATPKKLLVFDFGGGTCDVAVFQVGLSPIGRSFQVSPLAVSRYHRLGGGDIDRAILYEVLIPQLIEQNGLNEHSLTFEDKTRCIEPTLLGVAEALKIGLSNNIARLKRFGQYDSTDKAHIVKVHPGMYHCKLDDRTLSLYAPTLTAARFEEILKPFLDTDLLYARETEYRLTCSMFAPIQDALDRSKTDRSNIDLCLVLGGSSLIPHVPEAIDKYFERATLLTFPDMEGAQVAVARGAAYYSLSLALYGKSLFQLVVQDRISIRTIGGSYELIPKAAELPYPRAGEWASTSDLAVPESSLTEPVPLLVEILAGEDSEQRRLLTARWLIRPPIHRGDKLRLDYRFDENQVLHLRLTLQGQDDVEPFEERLESPLTNVVNPNTKRLKIQESEERIRSGKVPRERVPDEVVSIAREYADLQQLEKAISYLKNALRLKNSPDPYTLTLLGIYSGERGDRDSEEKFYREAIAAGSSAALFNLALAQQKRGAFSLAKKTIELRIVKCPDGPSYTLAAEIAESMNDTNARDSLLGTAMATFRALRSMDDWELGWYATACRMYGESNKLEEAQSEQRRRAAGTDSNLPPMGIPPEVISLPATNTHSVR